MYSFPKLVDIFFKERNKAIGRKILLDDGKISLIVKDVTPSEIKCTVKKGGKLSNRKSINIPNYHINMPYVSAADRADIEFGLKMGADVVAASFVRSADDVTTLRDFIDSIGYEHVEIVSKIENQINSSLANLLQYLWTSENTQNNINNTYGNANPVFDDINNIYPSVKDLDETKAPSSSDIDFIKNSLIRFQNQSIGYLTINGTYQNISSLTNIDPSIVDKASWDNYVDQNTFSIYNARTFLNKLSNSLPNLFAMSFSPNNANLNQYSYYFSIEDNTYLSHSDIYITALVFIFIGSYVIAMNKFKNNNYKNMENH